MLQKYLYVRRVKKNRVNHFGYNNSICIGVDQGFIRRYVVTPVSISYGHMFLHLLDPSSEDNYVWADPVDSGDGFALLFSLDDFESLIHK